jgi:hypothetical protein
MVANKSLSDQSPPTVPKDFGFFQKGPGLPPRLLHGALCPKTPETVKKLKTKTLILYAFLWFKHSIRENPSNPCSPLRPARSAAVLFFSQRKIRHLRPKFLRLWRRTGGRLLPRVQGKTNSRSHVLFASYVYAMSVGLYDVFADS